MRRFRMDIRRWATPADLARHLGHYDPGIALWWQRIVLHHTVVPTLAQWRGLRSMEAMANYYQRLGWPAGPHLFIAVGSPRPQDDGIWQMTALNERGIHAGVCNVDSVGIEVVGRYDAAPWAPRMRAVVYDVLVVLQRWQRRDIHIIGHRDCNSPKSCPGRAIDLHVVRRDVAEAMQ